MDKRLIDWENAENAYRNALRGLKTTIEETIFNIIPFNEDKRFIFEDDGVLDDYDLPEIWKYDSETSDILRGFEWYEDCRGKHVDIILGDEMFEMNYGLDELQTSSFIDIKNTIDEWLYKSGK